MVKGGKFMAEDIKAVAEQIYEPEKQLPFVLKTQDVMNLMRCSRPYAMEIIRKAEKKGVGVHWVGKQPRVNRDSFIEYLRTRKKPKEVTENVKV
jgi:hypothetical protein